MASRRRPALPVAFRYHDFRLLWLGQLFSVVGSQMQMVALNWHIWQLTHEPIYLGMLGLVRLVPIIVFSLIGGVLADAADRKRVMQLTQSAMAVVAAGLAALTFAGVITVWWIFALSALAAAAGAFDTPARQSLVPRLVAREHLPNALSVFTTMFQVAAIVGPALAGLLLPAGLFGLIYLANAISFLAVIGALALMRVDTAPRPGVPDASKARPVSLAAAVEGLRYVWGAPIIRSTMLLDFFATFFSSANQLLPVIADTVLHVDATWYALLYSAASAGALAAGTVMSTLGTIRRQGKLLLWAVAAYGLATVVFGFSQWPLLSWLALAGTGAADTVSMVLRNTIRQLATPDSLRGRMTSVNMIFFMGGPQLGEFEAASLAQVFGAPFSVVSGGIGCLLFTAWIAAKSPFLRGYHGEPVPAGAGGPAATVTAVK